MDSEKARKKLENITGLPITSEKNKGKKRTFTSTIYVKSKEASGGKKISFDNDEKRKKEEELRNDRSKRNKEQKSYEFSESWVEPEGNISVKMRGEIKGDFDSEKSENNSENIVELTEEEAEKIKSQGVKVEKVDSKSSNGKGKVLYFIGGGAFFAGLIIVKLIATKS